jgi:HEAT repeat protein
MKFASAVIGVFCLLIAGCGEIEDAEALAEAERLAAEKAAQEAAKWKPPEVAAKPPARKEFADIDEAWTVLSEAAKKENTDQIWAAIKWLAAQGQPTIERMTAIMNDAAADVADRLAACMVLGHIGDPARKELLAALTSDLFNVRARAAQELGDMRPLTKETIAALLKRLDDEKDNRVLVQVIKALGEIGEPAKAATPKLLAIRDGPDKYDDTLRNAAHAAVKKVDPRRDFTGLPLDE